MSGVHKVLDLVVKRDHSFLVVARNRPDIFLPFGLPFSRSASAVGYYVGVDEEVSVHGLAFLLFTTK